MDVFIELNELSFEPLAVNSMMQLPPLERWQSGETV